MELVAGDGSSTFGELLVRYRQVVGLTQEGLAEASGMSVRALRDLERGRTQAAQRRTAELLADALRLTGDDRTRFLAVARKGRRRTTPPPVPVSVSMLPPALPDLVGRAHEVAQLRDVATGGATVAVVGHPGVGKTALAVSVAHGLRVEFPDGCLVVDLRGLDDQPLTPRAALDRLLRGLGVAASEIPAAEADQVELYRAVLADRRVLVLLDNALDEAQVRPLLAAAPGCLTLVTCRRVLVALEGVRWLLLDPLAGGDAVELLARIAGADRVRAEPDAAAELVALCGNLPLAVRIAGNRLATRPHWSLRYLVELLRDERNRLASLSAGDLRVRSAFEMSYRRLSPGARTVFRRLATVPGADFGTELAGVAAGTNAGGQLDELADASLLQVTAVPGRFQFHDLIRLFAAEQWEAEETSVDRAQARAAVLGYLLRTATAAGSCFAPDASPVDEFAGEAEAGEWLVREESSWIAAARAAARLGWHREVLELAVGLHWYVDHRWLGVPWVEIFRLGVDAARALGDRGAEAVMLNRVGWATGVCLGDRQTSLVTHQQALAVAVEAGNRLEETWALAFVGTALMFLGRLPEALDHTRRAAALAVEFDFWTVGMPVRNRLARVLQAMGRHEEALPEYRAMLADADRNQGVATSKTRKMMMAYVKEGVGECLVALGEWQLAAETFHETRQERIELGTPGNVAVAALNEGRAWLAAGEYVRARECLEYALETYGDRAPNGRAQVLAELARLPPE